MTYFENVKFSGIQWEQWVNWAGKVAACWGNSTFYILVSASKKPTVLLTKWRESFWRELQGGQQGDGA